MFVDVIICCKIYFVCLIFVVRANHENILTTKISRSTVSAHRYMYSVVASKLIVACSTSILKSLDML